LIFIRTYERKKARPNTMVATKALAHKLARACFHILKQCMPFEAARCFITDPGRISPLRSHTNWRNSWT
jgi:hypothetical protein